MMNTNQKSIELVILNNDNQPVTTSLKVGEVFGKQHKDVMKAIRNLECPEDFRRRNFALTQQNVVAGAVIRKIEYFEITRDGLTLLAMGFTGKKAMKFKLEYIDAFNKMEEALLNANPIPAGLPNFRDPIASAEAWIEAESGRREEKKKRIAAGKEIKRLEHNIEEHKEVLRKTLPKVEQHERILGKKAKITMTALSNHFRNACLDKIELLQKVNKDPQIDVGVRKFIEFLKNKKILRNQTKIVPYKKYLDLGWFEFNAARGSYQIFATPLALAEVIKFDPFEVLQVWYRKKGRTIKDI